MIVKNKELSDASLWPLSLTVQDHGLSLELQVPKPVQDNFFLRINGQDYEILKNGMAKVQIDPNHLLNCELSLNELEILRGP